MTDHGAWRKNIPEGFDGRFGENFDDEISPKVIVKIAASILGTCVVALVVCLVVVRILERSAIEKLSKPPSPLAAANEPQVPSGPLLQVSPEAELVQMREEMSARLNSYGWIDEGRALVHIPIAKAIELVADGTRPQMIDSFAAEEGSEVEEAHGE
jgi:hypothetical protein